VRYVLALTVFLAIPLLAVQNLWGADLELGGGATFKRYEAFRDAGVVNLNLVTRAESRFPDEWSLGYILPQDKNGDFQNNDDPTAWAGVGKRFRWGPLILGLGLVAVNRTSQRISTHLNFKSEAGLRFGPVVALVQHISNAGLHGSNDGESFFTLGFRLSLGKERGKE